MSKVLIEVDVPPHSGIKKFCVLVYDEDGKHIGSLPHRIITAPQEAEPNRAAFENQFVAVDGSNWNRMMFERMNDGRYVSVTTQKAWEEWQAKQQLSLTHEPPHECPHPGTCRLANECMTDATHDDQPAGYEFAGFGMRRIKDGKANFGNWLYSFESHADTALKESAAKHGYKKVKLYASATHDERREEWQPIKSCPRFQNIEITNGEYVVKAILEDVDYDERGGSSAYGFTILSLPVNDEFKLPTHWRPLP